MQDIPYRPIFEALIVEFFIEVIREATIRLPAPIGPTIGIVGGLVIGRCDCRCRSRIEFDGHCRSDDSNFQFCRSVCGNEYDNTTDSISVYACSFLVWVFWHRYWDTRPFYPSDEFVFIETALFVHRSFLLTLRDLKMFSLGLRMFVLKNNKKRLRMVQIKKVGTVDV